MNQIEWKVKRSLYPVGVKASVFSVFAISIFQLAQLAPQFLLIKVPRNLSSKKRNWERSSVQSIQITESNE